jgi:hypothetical protein
VVRRVKGRVIKGGSEKGEEERECSTAHYSKAQHRTPSTAHT